MHAVGAIGLKRFIRVFVVRQIVHIVPNIKQQAVTHPCMVGIHCIENPSVIIAHTENGGIYLIFVSIIIQANSE